MSATTPTDGEAPLADGTYDVLVVDADNDSGPRVELVVTAGPAKGETVTLRTPGPLSGESDPLDLLGLPGTLTITGGHPTLALE
ncbi:MAG: hypothetical protein AAF467_11215 [Actinomycetota bacterium]